MPCIVFSACLGEMKIGHPGPRADKKLYEELLMGAEAKSITNTFFQVQGKFLLWEAARLRCMHAIYKLS